jgi:putative hemolysin
MRTNRRPRLALLSMGAAALLSCTSPSTAQPASPEPATSSGPAEPPESTPLPKNDNLLSDVTCPTPTDCIAVGYIGEGSSVGPYTRTLILQDTGGGWRVVPSPNAPGEAGSALSGVTCLGPGNCIAVGRSENKGSTPTTLIEQNVGSGWTIVPSPNANAFGGVGDLSAVACANPTHCVAVGRYESANGHFQTLIEDNAGQGWEVVPSPDPNTADDTSLNGVTCAGPSFCIAVGSHGSGDHELPLIQRNSGSGWTTVPTPGAGGLSGIACPTADFCVATGGNFSLSNQTIIDEPLIEEMKDGTWVSVATPQVGSLGRVACPTPTYCISIGGLFSLSTSTAGSLIVAERMSGGWTVPNRTSQIQNVTAGAVACPDADRCIVTGNQLLGPYPGVRVTFIVQHTSQGWSIQASPNV